MENWQLMHKYIIYGISYGHLTEINRGIALIQHKAEKISIYVMNIFHYLGIGPKNTEQQPNQRPKQISTGTSSSNLEVD